MWPNQLGLEFSLLVLGFYTEILGVPGPCQGLNTPSPSQGVNHTFKAAGNVHNQPQILYTQSWKQENLSLICTGRGEDLTSELLCSVTASETSTELEQGGARSGGFPEWPNHLLELQLFHPSFAEAQAMPAKLWCKQQAELLSCLWPYSFSLLGQSPLSLLLTACEAHSNSIHLTPMSSSN